MSINEEEDDVLSEIILISTSLGSVRKQFFDSKRLANLLDCKGVVYYHIDANIDSSSAKGLKDSELINEWKGLGIFKTDPNSSSEIVLPQLIIDGVGIGDYEVVQDFEDDGDLDSIFGRKICPGCLKDKNVDALECSSCGISFTNLIPTEYIDNKSIQRVFMGFAYDEDEDDEA